MVNLVKNPLVQAFHELQVLPHLLHVSHHFFLDLKEQRSGLWPQTAHWPVEVHEWAEPTDSRENQSRADRSTLGLSLLEIRSNMVPPVQVSPLIKTARWSALLIGLIYGKQRYDYLKPIAAEERRIEEEEKKLREEQERIYKQLSEANSDTILK
uniref:ATP synthase F(0) complex subunit e, mitochondrial n=1 Tax=Cyprinus carpio TaxID=7962 RepID=A0A8C2ER48_CYPCA